MAFDDELAERLRRCVGAAQPFTEQRMFGGLALMVDGHMTVGVLGEDLVARVGPEHEAAALARAHARPMDFTGRPLRGWVLVGAGGTRDDELLATWVAMALSFVRTLPSKRPSG